MIKNKEILLELQELSSVLANLPKVNCYKTPEAYFNATVAENADSNLSTLHLKNNLNENAFKLPSALDTDDIYFGALAEISAQKLPEILKNNSFSVPKNYFEELEENIVLSANAQNEDAANSNFPKMEYAVPENYFDNLSNKIFAKLNDDQALEKLNALLEQMRKEQVYKVPTNYFENLTDDIIANVGGEIAERKIKERVALENSFAVPTGYFYGLSSRIVRRINEEIEPELVEKRKSNNWSQWLSLAAVVIVFGLGMLFLSDFDNAGNSSNLNAELATLSDAEIAQFVADNEYDFDEYLLSDFTEMEGNLFENAEISEEDLDYYLEEYTIDELYDEEIIGI